MCKFKPGQKVFVKQLPHSSGIPMRYLKKIVTILNSNSNNADWPYNIVEDPRWVWQEEFFVGADELDDPNIIFKLNKEGKQ